MHVKIAFKRILGHAFICTTLHLHLYGYQGVQMETKKDRDETAPLEMRQLLFSATSSSALSGPAFGTVFLLSLLLFSSCHVCFARVLPTSVYNLVYFRLVNLSLESRYVLNCWVLPVCIVPFLSSLYLPLRLLFLCLLLLLLGSVSAARLPLISY